MLRFIRDKELIMLRGAIFDHDGLMFDTEKVWQANWKKVADEMGIVLPEEFTKNICGSSGQHMLDVIQKYYGVEDGTAIRDRVRQGVFDDEAKHLDMKEGLLDILEVFRKNGVKMAVASSSGKEMLERNLKNGGVDQYFSAVVSGQEVEHGKPSPDIFLLAAERIGIPAHDCYVFEDAFNGVQAGYAAGARTIMVPDLIQPDETIRQKAYAVCKTLKEAAERIEKNEF